MVSCLWPRTQVLAAAPKSAPGMSAGVTTVPVSVFSDGNSLPLTRFATQQSHTSAWSPSSNPLTPSRCHLLNVA